jgi:hypothetical protein
MIWGIICRNDKETPFLRGEVTSYHRRDLIHERKSLGLMAQSGKPDFTGNSTFGRLRRWRFWANGVKENLLKLQLASVRLVGRMR